MRPTSGPTASVRWTCSPSRAVSHRPETETALAQLESRNLMQMCQLFWSEHEFSSPRTRPLSRRQWRRERFGLDLCSLDDAKLDQTVSAMKWRCPRREPRNSLAFQTAFDRRLGCVDERV